MIGLILTPFVLYALLRLFEYIQVFQPRSDLITSPESIHNAPEDVFFPTTDGYRLNGWFFTATDESQWADWVILISHGNGGNISYRLDLYKLWLEEGFHVFAYDYRGYGLSSGRPSEKGTYEDAESAHRWLMDRGFSGNKIIALGESLGGGVATELAMRRTVGALVLQSTFTSIPNISKELFPWLPVHTVGTIRYDTQAKLPSLEVPILILHSREDSMIPFHHAEQNYQAANELKHFEVISGDHNDRITETSERYRQGIRRLKELLPSDASAGG
ncbi:MAG: Multifunctional-autoprocessing repeats-in-toxin [Verrucomicrobia subdivision 3 bacterium]|nr:Multifunctional-autoprocessing repeats-in-toxin [Limisphaerales bacterium]MCS1412530.1 Multifunctional-autoprocessing repeats-in-toxin [Limisphaerales bacterium]